MLPPVQIAGGAQIVQDGEQRVAAGEVLEEGRVRGQGGGDVGGDAEACFICPDAGDVVGGVAAAAEDEEGHVEAFDVGEAGAVGADVEVEDAELVAAE